MKTIVNKATTLPKSEKEMNTYADLAKAVVNQPSKEGFSYEEMRKRLRLLEQIEKAKETIELEDADCEHFKGLAEKMTWAVFHKEILSFCDEVKAM